MLSVLGSGSHAALGSHTLHPLTLSLLPSTVVSLIVEVVYTYNSQPHIRLGLVGLHSICLGRVSGAGAMQRFMYLQLPELRRFGLPPRGYFQDFPAARLQSLPGHAPRRLLGTGTYFKIYALGPGLDLPAAPLAQLGHSPHPRSS